MGRSIAETWMRWRRGRGRWRRGGGNEGPVMHPRAGAGIGRVAGGRTRDAAGRGLRFRKELSHEAIWWTLVVDDRAVTDRDGGNHRRMLVQSIRNSEPGWKRGGLYESAERDAGCSF